MKIAKFEIQQKDYDYFNYLVKEGDYGVEMFNLWVGATLFKVKTSFEDGYTASLEVYTTQEDVLCSVYLYSPEGDEIDYLESDEGFLEEYEFEGYCSDEESYRLIVEVIPGTYADLTSLEERVRYWGEFRKDREEIARTAERMITALEKRLKEEGAELNDLDFSSPENLHTSIDEIDPTGQIRCEDFMDHSWEYAGQFGELEDDEFEDAQWRCLEVATQILRERF